MYSYLSDSSNDRDWWIPPLEAWKLTQRPSDGPEQGYALQLFLSLFFLFSERTRLRSSNTC